MENLLLKTKTTKVVLVGMEHLIVKQLMQSVIKHTHYFLQLEGSPTTRFWSKTFN